MLFRFSVPSLMATFVLSAGLVVSTGPTDTASAKKLRGSIAVPLAVVGSRAAIAKNRADEKTAESGPAGAESAKGVPEPVSATATQPSPVRAMNARTGPKADDEDEPIMAAPVNAPTDKAICVAGCY